MSPRPRTSIRPIGVRVRDPETGLTVSRIVAYRALCTCGWRGHGWRSWAGAAAERRYHQGGHEV